MSRWYGDDYNVRERGLAPDMDKETRVVMHADEENYCWGYTYVLLSEWEAIYDKELETFKNKIKDHFNRAEHKTINEKLDKTKSKLILSIDYKKLKIILIVYIKIFIIRELSKLI